MGNYEEEQHEPLDLRFIAGQAIVDPQFPPVVEEAIVHPQLAELDECKLLLSIDKITAFKLLLIFFLQWIYFWKVFIERCQSKRMLFRQCHSLMVNVLFHL